MRIRIKRANVKRLASLSALGAGALAVTAGTAEAGIVYTPLSAKVGFSTWNGYSSSFSFGLPGTAGIGVSRSSWGGSFWWVWFFQSYGTVRFKPTAGHLGIFSAGKTWGNAGLGSAYRLAIATRWSTGGGSTGVSGNSSFDHKYALFRFRGTSSAPWEYGWLQLSHSISNTTGPDVTLEGWAYDDTGAPIAAGDTGGVPEPSTMALAGLGALALGAAGLRRWRAARKA